MKPSEVTPRHFSNTAVTLEQSVLKVKKQTKKPLPIWPGRSQYKLLSCDVWKISFKLLQDIPEHSSVKVFGTV